MSSAEEVAAAAARWVVEEGLEYGPAKRRAARDAGRRVEMPSNEAVEDAVREYLDVFCADTQPGELRALREVALQWMQRLAEFRPHLAGSAWRGTATRHSAVLLELYCDDPKAAEHRLIDKAVDYDAGQLDLAGQAEPVPVYTVASHSAALGDTVTVHLLVHDHDALRGALKPDSRGRSWRGDLASVQRLLADVQP